MFLRKGGNLVLGELSSRSLACKLKHVLRGNKHVINTKALYLPLKHQIIALSPFSSLCKCHNPRVGVSDFLWTSGTCHSKSFNRVRDLTIIINYFKIIIIITILVIAYKWYLQS